MIGQDGMLGSLGRRRVQRRYEPAADEGFLGPDSVSWRVWGHPSSWVVGFQRSVTIEMLDPNLHAAVEASGGVRGRPRTRYERTMHYFALQIFGDTRTATRAADVLVKVHATGVGRDPVTGGTFDANDPSSQLWIHMTAWHSILYCYERMGPGPLSPEDEERYWQECAVIAELTTADPDEVPRSREEVRAYFDEWRPRLAASELAQTMAAFILSTEVALPEDVPAPVRTVLGPAAGLFGRAVVSTYPRHVRRLLGVRQPAAVDVVLQQGFRLLHAAVAANPVVRDAVGRWLVPGTMQVAAGPLLGVPAATRGTTTPREAQARDGFDPPALAHADFRARQRRRVLDDRVAPEDEGLRASEAIIGERARATV